MIENDTQLEITKSQIKKLQKAQSELQATLDELPDRLKNDDDLTIIRKAQNDALQSLIDELQEEIDDYLKRQTNSGSE